MKLYLIQHGEAKHETEDPERSLTVIQINPNALDEFKYNCHLAVGKDLWRSLHFHTDPNLF